MCRAEKSFKWPRLAVILHDEDDFDTWKELKCVLLAFAQVKAQLPGATEARRSPAAVVFASGLAWAAVTFSANAADLSAGMSLCWPKIEGTLFACN